MSKTTNYSAREFYLDDFPKTLFPLSTNRVLVEHGSERLSEYAKQLIEKDHSFNNQQRVHANKDALHFRRTVKLDAVAEYFLYELIYKNRASFKKPHSEDKRHYGYRFVKGRPISASRSYADFKEKINDSRILFEEYISFDIAAYFNNIYHHDIQRWFGSTGADEDSVEALGKFLRETNAGRSLDCLPQGLYPAKMIGNDFLRFIEESAMLRSEAIIRFMDDVYLFDDDTSVVRSDFAAIQKLVGAKGLSVNASKTQESGHSIPYETDDEIDELKKRLLRRRREIVVSHYDFADMDIDADLDEDELPADDNDEEGAIEFADDESTDEDLSNTPLSSEELAYLSILLNKPHLSEEDAELILVVVRDNAEIISEHLPIFLEFPHLAKNFYAICKDIDDKESVSEVVLSALRSGRYVGEFQLFWFGFMLESYLMDTKNAPKLIRGLFNHSNATSITKAKILEIADNRYGLPDLRSQYLKDGRSDWLSWASAVGCRNMNAASRNYELKYFANGSDFNRLIAEIISDI